MPNRSGIAQTAEALVTDALTAMGLDLVDVEYVREGGARFLRFYVDKRGGVSIDDCAEASRAIDPLLDAGLSISESYYLEVSSPGLTRPLKKDADFQRHLGEEVEVSLYQARDGVKRFEGELMSYDTDGTLFLRTAGGEELRFEKAETARVRRVIRF